MTFRTLDDLGELRGRTVFVRVDFNVQLVDGEVLDDTRLTAALPTVRELSERGARVVLASHCGRPSGEPDPAYSLALVAEAFAKRLGAGVRFAADCVGPLAEAAIAQLADGDVCLLENLRFHAGEKANDPEFAEALASGIDVFVNDAFGTAHRAHASVVGVAERVADKAAGRLLARELEVLGGLLGKPERPFVAVLGGAKVSGKAATLENLLPRLDALVLGGGMANTFLAAKGYDLGLSLVEAERIELAREMMATAAGNKTEILLPSELVVTDDFANPTVVESVAVDAVPADRLAVDIGEAFRPRVAELLARARTIFWNGPLGVFEKPPFDAGTLAVAEAVAASDGISVVGGGETVAAAKQAGVADRIDHISTGGGAALELLAGATLPGVAALEEA